MTAWRAQQTRDARVQQPARCADTTDTRSGHLCEHEDEGSGDEAGVLLQADGRLGEQVRRLPDGRPNEQQHHAQERAKANDVAAWVVIRRPVMCHTGPGMQHFKHAVFAEGKGGNAGAGYT